MQLAVMAAGAVAQLAGWWLVAFRGRDVWRVLPPILAAMGAGAVLARPPVATNGVAVAVALAAGAASGVAFYGATRLAVGVAARRASMRDAVAGAYERATEVSLARSLVLSLVFTVPGEELFWRGLFQGHASMVAGAATGAAIAWAGYGVVNLTSANPAIVAGAVVGGALWTGLAWWSGGVLASLASHILWTGAMLALPPGAGRKVVRA